MMMGVLLAHRFQEGIRISKASARRMTVENEYAPAQAAPEGVVPRARRVRHASNACPNSNFAPRNRTVGMSTEPDEVYSGSRLE